MRKKFISAILISALFATNITFASSYIDNQIKSSKKAKKYHSVQKHSVKHNLKAVQNHNLSVSIKDPKLISFKKDKIKDVSDKNFQKKLQSDDAYYTKKIAPYLKADTYKYNKTHGIDLFNLYKITERIVRANKLDYINWRIVLINDKESFNAHTTEANLICINTALYDSLYNNDDAMAFVIGHEIAHQIYGHTQQSFDMAKRTKTTNNVLLFTTLGYGSLIYQPIRDRVVAKEERAMEYAADTLGFELLYRAGFDEENAMSALNFINSLPHIVTQTDSHPDPEKRIENIKTSKKYFIPEWIEEGKYNIYNSKPLQCKKSSDRASIIISASENNKNGYYSPETPEDLLKRVGYFDYKNGNTKGAIKYFSQWAELTDSYIPHLYLSYCYEQVFLKTQKPKLYKKAINEAHIANSIEPNNKHIEKQLKDLENINSL